MPAFPSVHSVPVAMVPISSASARANTQRQVQYPIVHSVPVAADAKWHRQCQYLWQVQKPTWELPILVVKLLPVCTLCQWLLMPSGSANLASLPLAQFGCLPSHRPPILTAAPEYEKRKTESILNLRVMENFSEYEFESLPKPTTNPHSRAIMRKRGKQRFPENGPIF